MAGYARVDFGGAHQRRIIVEFDHILTQRVVELDQDALRVRYKAK
jgi:hypothetical protein